jgi:acyl-CoA reductase-like NAD-dependent aldehyde dehydrogenase
VKERFNIMKKEQNVSGISNKPGKIEVFCPINAEKIGDVPSFSSDEALKVLHEVQAAQKQWARTPLRQRAKIIQNFGRILHENVAEVTRLLTSENGKPLYESYAHEVLPMTQLAAYFAKQTKRILKPVPITLHIFKNRKSYLHFKPRGVSFIISPWNFPFAIPTSAIIMNLMAGNGVLLKPASLTPMIAYKIRELFDAAGLDPKLFQVISGPGKMAEELIEKGADLINFVSFTGSTEIGKHVASLCGKKLIPCSVELGGKDAAIICSDANIQLAAKSVINAAFGNCGQGCASV